MAISHSNVRCLVGAIAAGLLATACKVTSAPWCWELEYGDCPSQNSGYATQVFQQDTIRVMGFPSSKVVGYIDATGARLYRGELTVGDTLTLYLLAPARGDTIRSVTWNTDPASPQLRAENAPTGKAKVTAVAAGSAYVVNVNGQSLNIWTCGSTISGGCARLAYIAIAP